MNCRNVRKVSQDYFDEVLGSEERRLVQEHVAGCDTCRRELDALQSVLRLVDDVRVEYPPVSVWRNFLPDLHRRIVAEAALSFNKQRRQRLYFSPGWAASFTAVTVILLVSLMMRDNPSPVPAPIQRSENIEIVESSSEPILIAGMISEVLITEAEAAELRKLRSFIQSDTLTFADYEYYEILAGMRGEASGSEEDGGYIDFLLENGFEEFGDSSTEGSDSGELGAL